jgi:predicted adenylyl cyclase CyaB
MGRNVEIKARISNVDDWLDKAKSLADFGPVHISQDDTFFVCPSGRLKLRAFSSTNGELIYYQRPNSAGPKESMYSIVPTSEPDALRNLLVQSLGQVGRVRKSRILFLAGRTRIHLDRVEGLGDFIELEVVLNEGEPLTSGFKVATDLLTKLKIPAASFVEGAYVDLMNGQGI